MSVVREIAVRSNCAALLNAHTKKPPVASSDGFAGEMDSARGASSQFGVIRIGATLFSASAKDAKKWSMQGSHLDYVRLDIAKNNLARRTGEPMWFKRDSVTVGGMEGESVGILRPVELAESAKRGAIELAEIIAGVIARALPAGQWHRAAHIKAEMTKDEIATWPADKNATRDFRNAFDGADEIMTRYGILSKITGDGKAGTRFKLNSSFAEIAEELAG